jgi:hypothetical protein
MEIWEIYMETQIEAGPAKVSIAAQRIGVFRGRRSVARGERRLATVTRITSFISAYHVGGLAALGVSA